MRRRIIVGTLQIMLALLPVLLILGLRWAWGEQGSVRIQGRGGQIAEVNHAGALQTTGGASGGGDAVNVFHQSTIAHVSSVTHVRGSVQIISQSGAVVTVTGTALDVNCTGCAAASVVNVGHISGMLHVSIVDFPRWAHMAVAQSGTWTIQQAHQAGQWNVAHATSVTHVSGGVYIRDPSIATWARVTHTGELTVNCTTGCSAGSSDAVNVFHQSTVRHVSSITHVAIVDWQRWAHLGAAQSGNWTVQAAHQAGVWNTGHVSAVTHVMILDLPRFAHIAVEQSGAWNILAAHQGGQWNRAHSSVVTHAVIVQSDRNRLGMHVTDAACLTCQMRVDHYNAVANQPHISGALRAWRVSSCGATASVAVASNANRRDLIITVAGNRPVYIGYGTAGHVALTQANGFPLHAMGQLGANPISGENHRQATLTLPNYSGPLACIAPASSDLAIIEILR